MPGGMREMIMRALLPSFSRLAAALLGATVLGAGVTLADQAQTRTETRNLSGSFVSYYEAREAALSGHGKNAIHAIQRQESRGSSKLMWGQSHDGGKLLPLFEYNMLSARDGLAHRGVLVGSNPFTDKRTSTVPAKIIPVVLIINSIATGFDAAGNPITTPGHVVINPTAPDNNCLSAPNNVPVKVMRQSPLFDKASFSFGGTFVGHTQYEDANMRANFYGALQGDPDGYHVLFEPVDIVQSLVLNVPASQGVTITDASVLGGGFCTPLTIINIDWLDQMINDQVLPAYATQGVNPASLPIFFLYDTFMSGGPPGLGDCCIGGYHSFGGFPTPTQAYSVVNFDVTGIFGSFWPDSAIGAHELGEFINDPWGNNLVPPWGGTGQVSGCQGNLEVGDPLTGSTIAPVTMPNGFTYHLQELAFFSWFFGGPSLGVNGWYSNNGTFLTDAGPPCQLQ
jgi:hypothetical protein